MIPMYCCVFKRVFIMWCTFSKVLILFKVLWLNEVTQGPRFLQKMLISITQPSQRFILSRYMSWYVCIYSYITSKSFWFVLFNQTVLTWGPNWNYLVVLFAFIYHHRLYRHIFGWGKTHRVTTLKLFCYHIISLHKRQWVYVCIQIFLPEVGEYDIYINEKSIFFLTRLS